MNGKGQNSIGNSISLYLITYQYLSSYIYNIHEYISHKLQTINHMNQVSSSQVNLIWGKFLRTFLRIKFPVSQIWTNSLIFPNRDWNLLLLRERSLRIWRSLWRRSERRMNWSASSIWFSRKLRIRMKVIEVGLVNLQSGNSWARTTPKDSQSRVKVILMWVTIGGLTK